MKTILVPTDFSPNALTALRYAEQMARHAGARLVIFHSCYGDDEQAAAKIRLDAIAADIQPHITCTIHSSVGEVADTLPEVCRRFDVDLVVMGMKGYSVVNEILVGSNTIKAVEAINKPLLIIPQDFNYQGIHKIMLASDLQELDNDDAFDPLVLLASLFGAEVRIVTVHRRHEHSTWAERLERKREDFIFGKQIRHSFKVVVSDSVIEGLNYYLHYKGDHDMLVMLKRRKNWFERTFLTSYTKKMIYIAHLPLLILHE